MTDLTPEQIEKWARDDSAAEAFYFSLQFAFSYLKRKLRPQSTEARGALHAHAKMLQQQAENAEKQATIERLRDLIQDWYDYGYERSEAEKILQALRGEDE